MRIGIMGLAASLVLGGTAAAFATTAPTADDAATTARSTFQGVAAVPGGDIVIARRGADDQPGDDRGGRGRGQDDKGKDDKGGKSGKGKGGKGRGGNDDGPNHDRNDDHGNHGPNHT
jgi:hypothetical protein